VLESAGSVTLTVQRKETMDCTATVGFRTRPGTATAGTDYVHLEGRLTFNPNEEEQTITVTILDPQVDNPDVVAVMGSNTSATVVIIDDDLPGIFSFAEEQICAKEGVSDIEVEVTVQRSHGSTGKVLVKYHTEDGSALAGLDYEAVEGEVLFLPGVTSNTIMMTVKARGRYESKDNFRLVLTECTGGGKFDPHTDGGEDECACTIVITDGEAKRERVDKLMAGLQEKWAKAKVGHSNWRAQFQAAIYVNGGDDDGEEEESVPSMQDYVMHIITVPWKLLFAFVPPVDYCDGWLCFVVSLIFIGGVTAIIGDLAALVGCTTEVIPDEVTAITLVALGTSLPDTFASKAAAMQDPYADASVGNVTGSNSVNVFLGLGLPWMMGSLYWTLSGSNAKWRELYSVDIGGDIDSAFSGGAFVVKAKSLGFSVVVFSSCALTAIMLLLYRRKVYGGELGGPKPQKYVHAGVLVGLWLVYIAASTVYAIANE